MCVIFCLLSLQDKKAEKQHKDELDWALGKVSFMIAINCTSSSKCHTILTASDNAILLSSFFYIL